MVDSYKNTTIILTTIVMKTNFLLCIAFRAMLLMGSQILASHALCAQSGATYERGETRLENVVPPSPESASHVRYVDVPMSYCTGRAQMAIPIYTLQGRSLSIPISLQYSSGGIKVDEIAGVAGLGWSLEAGGCITRDVRYMPDEFTGQYGHMYTRPPESVMNALLAGNGDQAMSPYLLNIFRQRSDWSSDRYNYNFCGLSGSFILTPEYEVVQLSGDGVEIDFDSTQDLFRVTGPDGTRYLFTARERANHYAPHIMPSILDGQAAIWEATTAWYLTEVESMDGTETAALTYAQAGVWNLDRREDTRTQTWRYGYANQNLQIETEAGSDTKFISHRHNVLALQSISMNGTTVQFGYSPNPGACLHLDEVQPPVNYPVRLSSIRVLSPTCNELLLMNVGTVIDAVDGRVLLSSLTEYHGNEQTDYWNFSYKTRTEPLSSFSQDWYGYYNAEMWEDGALHPIDEPYPDRHSRSPYRHDLYSGYLTLAYGTPRPDQADYLMLLESNHNGARTHFEYEGNRISVGPNDTTSIGVRVRQIIVSDGDTPVRIRRFTYEQPVVTGASMPSERMYTTPSVVQDLQGNLFLNTAYTWTLTYHESPVDWGPAYGDVMYGRVTEDICPPGSDTNGARTVYTYDTTPAIRYLQSTIDRYPSGWISVFQNGPAGLISAYTNASLGYREEGPFPAPLLIKREDYKWDGIAHALISSEEIEYSSYIRQPVLVDYVVHEVASVSMHLGVPEPGDLYHYPVWANQWKAHEQIRKVRVRYPDSGANDTTVVRQTFDSRPDLSFPSRPLYISISGADGIRACEYQYASDYLNPVGDGIVDSLVLRHVLSIPMVRSYTIAEEQETMVIDTVTNQPITCLIPETVSRLSQKTEYNFFPMPEDRTALMPSRWIEYIDDRESWSETVLSRDNYGNIRSLKEKGHPETTFLWSYGGQYPVAMVENASAQEVITAFGGQAAVNSFASNTQLTSSDETTLRNLATSLPSSHVTTYTYQPGVGMTSKTDQSGIKTSYEYDTAGRLQNVRDGDGHMVESYQYCLLNDGHDSLHVRSRFYRNASGTQYTDDYLWWNTLGLKTQEISIGGAGDGRDLVCAYEGDFMLHDDVRSWLPYPKQATGGAFQISAADSSAVYHDNPKAYVAKGYEMSTRDRVQSTALPGYDGEHMGSFHEQSPGSIPLLQWDDTTGSVVNRGTWPMDEVVAEVSKDADGRGRAVVKDLFGRTLQTSAAMRPSGPAIHGVDSLGSPTRYIYDNHDRLRAVAGADIALTDTLNMWRYSYDTLGRLASKGIPGSIREHYTYDEEDRIVRIRRGTEVTGMEYDAFGRLTRKYYAPSAAGDSVLVEEHVYDTRPPVADTLLAPDPNQSLPFGWWGPVKGFETWCRLAETDGTGQVTGYADRAFRYDSRGRLVQEVTRWPDGDRTEHSYLYDFCNNPLSDTWSVTVGDTTYTQSTDVQYDLRERPVRMEMSFYKGNMLVARDTTLYTYDALGRLAGMTSSSGGCGVSQTDEYTLQGWLKQRTASLGTDPLFVESFLYDSDIPSGFSPSYSGKIASKTEQWKFPEITLGHMSLNVDRIYSDSYEYDHLGRLKRTGGWHATGQSLPLQPELSGVRMTYDERGNILSSSEYTDNHLVDRRSEYHYSGDRLQARLLFISHITPSVASFSHDPLGRMTQDGIKNLGISYNRMDLPSQIRLGIDSILVNYSYLADGMKTSALKSNGEGLVYRGGMVFRRDTDGSLRFESAPLATGRMTADGIQYHITDHLGSVRAVIDAATGDILEASEYTAFGERTDITSAVRHGLGQVSSFGDPSLRQHFSGKEDQAPDFSVSSTDFGARHYAPHLSRWMVPDPMGEKYYDISPYVYCANDPVNYVDPKGDDIWEIDEIGNVVNRTKDKTMDAVYLVQQLNNGEFVRRQDSSGNDLGVVFEYGTIEHQWSRTYDGGVDDIFVVRGDNNGTKLFEFLADNITFSSGIEFSLSETGLKGDEGLNYISTSHTINSEKSFRRLFYSQLYNGYTIRRHTHSHPNHSTASDGDKNARDSYNKKLTKKGLKKIDFNIYFVGNEKKGRKHIYTKY